MAPIQYTEQVQKDPLIRSIDPRAMRQQLARRGPKSIQDHPLWAEAKARFDERLTYIRTDHVPQQDRLHHDLAHFGQAMNHPARSLQMIRSLGLLAYLSDVRSTLAFWVRLLKPGGLLMFVTLGPDSFRSFAKALGDIDQTRHVPGYPDMHDIGDALIALGCENPVMDAEWLNLSYASPESALADLRLLGGNPLLSRPSALSGRGWQARCLRALESLWQEGRIMLQVELVFGHAWAAPPKSAAGTIDQQQVQTIRWVGKAPKNLASDI
jgi:malonyl-CoA O-methyltransferase